MIPSHDDNSMNPLVSVIVCVYNAGGYLRESLQSVLNQTYSPMEIIVVDDGSTDQCMDSIRDICDSRVRVITQKNLGKPAALNAGIAVARGEFYAVHDADDISDPTRIAAQATCLMQNPDVAAVFCGNDLIVNNRRMAPIARAKTRRQCQADIAAFHMPAHDPTGMYRLSMVRSFAYDISLPIVEGYDHILRVGEKYPMLVIGQCLYGYRIHPDSVTRKDPGKRNRLVEDLLRRACNRRGVDPMVAFPHVFSPGAAPTIPDDNNFAVNFIESVMDLLDRGHRLGAIVTGARCAMLRPMSPHYYKALIYAILPGAAVAWIRSRGRGATTPERQLAEAHADMKVSTS
jgi:glycosyltransferase involved in cell wall biosynthesis